MKEKVRERWEKVLLQLELIKEGDAVEEAVVANYLRPIMKRTGEWVQGDMVFTRERVVWISKLGGTSFSIPYKDIREVSPASIFCFIPMGIMISAYDAETQNIISYLVSVSKRNHWIDYISKKMR